MGPQHEAVYSEQGMLLVILLMLARHAPPHVRQAPGTRWLHLNVLQESDHNVGTLEHTSGTLGQRWDDEAAAVVSAKVRTATVRWR